ncbi:MAG: hypothetical protein F6J86_31160 [Symploca sp. SIO1B1]|nr:hypothetical protein [Symploca sp. SIO1B1]
METAHRNYWTQRVFIPSRRALHLVGEINSKIHYEKVYEGSGRPCAKTPFRRVRRTTWSLTYHRCEAEIEAFQTVAGWRLYVTNASGERLSLEKVGHRV